MGRAENAIRCCRMFGRLPYRAFVIVHKSLPELLVKRTYPGFEFAQHPVRELAVLFLIFLNSIKYGRLDVSDDQTVKIVEQAPFNDLSAQFQPLFFSEFAALKLIEQKGRDHFVGLLVHLIQLHRTQFVIPASHVGTGEDKLQQAFSQGLHGASA